MDVDEDDELDLEGLEREDCCLPGEAAPFTRMIILSFYCDI